MIFYIAGTILLTLFGGLGLFFAKSPKARRWLKTKVKNRWRSQAGELGKARTARGSTPRAQVRKKRKAQPLGLLVRKRTADDPRLPRRLVNRVKVAAANRKTTTVDKPRLALGTRIAAAVNPATSDGTCGYTGTRTGKPCRLPKVIGGTRCQIHGGVSQAAS